MSAVNVIVGFALDAIIAAVAYYLGWCLARRQVVDHGACQHIHTSVVGWREFIENDPKWRRPNLWCWECGAVQYTDEGWRRPGRKS